ncbi:MAG: GNAT family N-acetyltransferase [Bradyrhizobium sp.]|uniref:GNAT family N-acetyltransferase n=1 Tax=Bradyrhizobium sp. TaxID=376 RepID=UPI0025C1CA5F|nr:GNAT family N-acetyltransferase [Bradyrhizobium sp.]MBI5261942.1 GNAT family N-acetyltransferase [Bradyrhizobium sp.]
MAEAAHYSATEILRDGRKIVIRALRPEDEKEMLAVLAASSLQSLRRRFFVARRHFSEKEIAFFMNVDFRNQVALVGCSEENGRPAIVGGARYIVTSPGSAEVAFFVVDAFQGRGVGSILARHLVQIARESGLHELVADVLAENGGMLNVLKKQGFEIAPAQDPQTIHLVRRLA